MNTPDDQTPYAAPRSNTAQASPPSGSLPHGFALGWGVMIASVFISALLLGAVGALGGPEQGAGLALAIAASAIPPAALIGTIVWCLVKGKGRTALGVLAAVLSVLAMLGLLIAACFGLMA